MKKELFVYDAKRTPIGSFQGSLSHTPGYALAIPLLLDFAQKTNAVFHHVIMGNVLSAGQGQAPTRQAVIHALNRYDISCSTVNKVCGSGMQSVVFAATQLLQGELYPIVAGGFESMSNAPYLLPKARTGYRMGHEKILDHMLWDGLEDAYHQTPDGKRRSMGSFADATAERCGFSRKDQERFVEEGLLNYHRARESALFDEEIIPVSIEDPKKQVISFVNDECPERVKIEKFPVLKPAFSKEGTVTAATSSAIADGAAALLLGTADMHTQFKNPPLARLVGWASHAQEPEWFTLAPIGAIQNLLEKIHWTIQDVDLFEVNEAFAVVPMAVIKELHIDRSQINVRGGACILGHPIGASGGRVIVTLIHALREQNKKRGIACVCIGGGEALAVALEIL